MQNQLGAADLRSRMREGEEAEGKAMIGLGQDEYVRIGGDLG